MEVVTPRKTPKDTSLGMISYPRGEDETAAKMVANCLKYHRECQEKKA